MELDRLDRRLLDLVQADASRTAEALAAHVALSPSAIQRRLKRLREAGVILRDVSVVDPARLGGAVLFLAALQVERERADLMDRLRAWLAAEPAVQEAFYVTGEADFMLVVATPDTAAYDALMARLVADNPNVRRFTTSVALGVVKRSLALSMAP